MSERFLGGEDKNLGERELLGRSFLSPKPTLLQELSHHTPSIRRERF
jgi:hypothetical protein